MSEGKAKPEKKPKLKLPPRLSVRASMTLGNYDEFAKAAKAAAGLLDFMNDGSRLKLCDCEDEAKAKEAVRVLNAKAKVYGGEGIPQYKADGASVVVFFKPLKPRKE